MTMEPSPEYVERQFQLADEALDDPRYLLEDNRLKAAANRAYYAMFHAVQAALHQAQIRRPKTHGGTIRLFGTHFVRTRQVDRRFARDLQHAFHLRQQSDYEVFSVIGDDTIREITDKAQEFIAEVRKVISDS
ncbi:MAG: HEPN domain-containing protein [Dehalococcoidia bacterium]